jgi:stage V sporulation protein G
MENITIETRIYPIHSENSNTRAFATASFSLGGEPLFMICGIRIVHGKRGMFVSMPQSMDKNGKYHDVAYPLDADLHIRLNDCLLKDYANAVA